MAPTLRCCCCDLFAGFLDFRLLDGVELNGCSGVVEAWLPESEATADDGGRWRVRVRSRVWMTSCDMRQVLPAAGPAVSSTHIGVDTAPSRRLA